MKSPRSLSPVTIATSSPSASGVARSRSLAVDDGDHRRLGQAASRCAAASRRRWCRRPTLTRRTVGQPDRDLVGHGADGTGAPRRRREPVPTAVRPRGCEDVGARPARRGGSSPAPWPLPCRSPSSSTHLGGLGRRERLGLLGGVLVDVLLAGELADLEHHLVDDLAQHQAVVGAVGVAARRRSGRPKRTSAGLNGLRATWRPAAGSRGCPTMPDRDDRRAGAQGEAGRAGVAPVEPAVAGAGALGVDAEELAPLEHPGGGVERPLGRRCRRRGRSGSCRCAGKRYFVFQESMYSALPTKVMRRGRTSGQEERVDHRGVVRAEDAPARSPGRARGPRRRCARGTVNTGARTPLATG